MKYRLETERYFEVVLLYIKSSHSTNMPSMSVAAFKELHMLGTSII